MIIIAEQAEPWISPGGVAILSGIILLLCGIITAIVELRKARLSQGRVEHEMKPNHGGSLRDAVNNVGTSIASLDDKVDNLTARLVRLETLNEVHFGLNGRASNGK